jgi:UDP-N-acetylmuramyl pentapeptide phosphotransferase/UDP-N-acetylglucosamine-1-phosphate transferase
MNDIPLTSALVGMLTSFAVCILLIITQRWHGALTLDQDSGVQKSHTVPTLRVGGGGIMVGLAAAWLLAPDDVQGLFGLLLLAALPAFGAGLMEDLTKRVGVRDRLLATMLSGVAAALLTGVSLTHLHIWGMDYLLTFSAFSIVFTAFAVGGVANAINIIDGYNGLASGTVVMCLAGLGLIAFGAGDIVLAKLCLLLGATIVGFLVVNFPLGKIFLGDGGAYTLGFLLAWVAVMLPMRNPEVSVWAPLLVCAYPVYETIFTIARRYWGKKHPGLPDNAHLHNLFKVAIARRYFGHLPPHLRNSMVSPCAWCYSLLPVSAGVMWYANTALLVWLWFGSFLLYAYIYWRLTGIAGNLPVKAPAVIKV